jgi:hypothetical protein
MALAPITNYSPSLFQWYTWDQQNSAMLLLALTRSRGGVSLNLDDLGSDTTADLTPPPPTMAPQQLPQGLLPNVRIIVDAWKQPVVFFRWAASNDELDSLDPAGPQDVFRDPQDPNGVLLNSAWWNSGPSVSLFQAYCHPLFTFKLTQPTDGTPFTGPYPPNPPTNPLPYYVWGKEYYMVPVVASAGKNKQFGFGLPTPSGPLSGPPYLAPLPWNQTQISQLAAWYGMKPDGTGDDQDNIYSYRLR